MVKKILKATTPDDVTPVTTEKAKDSLLPKIKPKKAKSGYMFFFKDNFAKLKEQHPTLKLGDIAKKMGETWNLLSKVEKKPLEILQEKDKVRHAREMEQFTTLGYFTNEQGVKSTDIKISMKDFPEGTVLPKRVKSNFVIFQAENVKRIHAANPKQPVTETMKQSAAEWAKLSKGKLAHYAKLQEADKKRYEKQVKQLEKCGYFVSEDGTKSTDMKFKPKKHEREAMKVRSDKAKAVKEKTIAKNKVRKAAEVAKKRALVQKLKDSAQKEQARKNALKAREQVKLLKLKESKKREVEKARAKKSKLIELEKAQKAKARATARNAKLKAASKKSKSISKGRTLSLKRDSAPKKETVSKTKQSLGDEKMALKVFTKSKIKSVLLQCSGQSKPSKMKEATTMIKEMWEHVAASTRQRYLRKARQAANDTTSKLKQA